jgi:hypothetical protein
VEKNINAAVHHPLLIRDFVGFRIKISLKLLNKIKQKKVIIGIETSRP